VFITKGESICLLFIHITPFTRYKGEEIYREGFHPSLTYTPPSLAKGRGSGGWVAKQFVHEREAS